MMARDEFLTFREQVKLFIFYLIGEKFGAYGYLDFYKWVDKTEYCRYKIFHKAQNIR